MSKSGSLATSTGDLGQKLAALGAIAAKVAHELNSPLDGSQRFINLALRIARESGQKQIAGYLEESLAAHTRMKDVVRELLDFVRCAGPRLEEHDIASLVQEAVRASRDVADASGVVVVTDIIEPAPRVRGNGLFQVFANVVRNALDAMPSGGTLRISAWRSDESILIRFQDSGIGLPDNPERIFEPLFSTKPAERGTGLGLAIAREIVVKQYLGRISARHGATGGAVIEVEIPLTSCVAGVEFGTTSAAG